MITLCQGNLMRDGADALVNPINCAGAMGAGLALQFKRAYPDMNTAYTLACARGAIRPGRIFVYSTASLSAPYYIFNFPTKRHWREASKIEYIDDGLAAMCDLLPEYSVDSIALPALGCGLGGLPWETVREHIEDALGHLPGIDIRLYAPHGAANAQTHASAPAESLAPLTP